MMIKGKKAQDFDKIFIGFVFIIAITIVFTASFKELDEMKFPLGHSANKAIMLEKKADLGNTIRNADFTEIISDAKRELYLMGGYEKFNFGDECGAVDGYNIWLNGDKVCRPDIEKEFQNYINANYEKYKEVLSLPEMIITLTYEDGKYVVYGVGYNEEYLKNSEEKIFQEGNTDLTNITYISKPQLIARESIENEQIEQIFTLIEEKLKNCKDEECILKEINDFNSKSEYQISFDCEEGEEKIEHEFFEQYQKCTDSFDADCLCEIEMPLEEGDYIFNLEGKEIGFSGETYEFPSNTTNYVRIINGKDDSNVETYYSVNGSILYQSKKNSGRFSINYYDPVKEDFRTDSNSIFFYKDQGSGLSVVINPEAAEEAGIGECRKFESYEYKLCTKTKEKELQYDIDKKSAEIDYPEIRFALRINMDVKPRQVEMTEVKDMEEEENTVEIRFKRNPEDEVVFYRIYYSEEEFTDTDDAVYFDEVINRKDISEFTEKAELEDGKEWYVTVTAVNYYGVENKDVQSYRVIPVDDVAPAATEAKFSQSSQTYDEKTYLVPNPGSEIKVEWSKQTKNENRKAASDIEGYYILYAESPEELNNIEPQDAEDCKSRTGCAYIQHKNDQNSYSYALTGISAAQYYIRVTAFDEVNNYNGRKTQTSGGDSNLIWPVDGDQIYISSCYGWRELEKYGEMKMDWHSGIDISVAPGTSIRSVADGEVIFTCFNRLNAVNDKTKRRCNGYGGNIIIYHPQLGTYSRYSHLWDINVAKGDYVEQGQIIASSGNTGFSHGAHLDFKYFLTDNYYDKVDDYSENPRCYLPNDIEVIYTSGADSCRDTDGDGTQFCSSI